MAADINHERKYTHTEGRRKVVYGSKMGKYRVYYNRSFIHHKLVFVTYYMLVVIILITKGHNG